MENQYEILQSLIEKMEIVTVGSAVSKTKLNRKEIIDFVRIMNRYEYDADVKYGSMVVDAKSIVGVLSLARSKTVEVILHTDECQNLLDEIAQFAA